MGRELTGPKHLSWESTQALVESQCKPNPLWPTRAQPAAHVASLTSMEGLTSGG